MPTELDELIRDAGREPGHLPDVDAAWTRGRRRHVLRTAGLTTGIATLVLVFVVGTVTVMSNRSAEPRFVDDPAAADGTAGPGEGEGGTSWASLTADEALEELAQAADRQAATYSEPDGRFYRYLRYRRTYPTGDGDVEIVKEREQWNGTDGSGRIYETLEGYRYRTEEARGQQPEPNLVRMELPPGYPAWPLLDELPRDSGELESWLRERYINEEQDPGDASEPPVSERMFTAVTDHLRAPALPPGVRASLLRVAASSTDLEYLGATQDPEGREVIGFAMELERGRYESRFYVSPETAELRWELDVALVAFEGSDVSPPVTTGEVVYLENAVVTELPPRPHDVEDAGEPDPPPPSEGPTG